MSYQKDQESSVMMRIALVFMVCTIVVAIVNTIITSQRAEKYKDDCVSKWWMIVKMYASDPICVSGDYLLLPQF